MSTTVTTTKRESRFVLNLRKYGLLYLMTLPGLAYLLINNYLPMAGLVIAFKDVDFRKGLFGSDWIGFKNFEYLFASSDALQITRNTLLYNLVFIVLNIVIPVTLAVLINQLYSKFASKAYQTMMFFPYFMSWVVISYFVYAFLNPDKGLANSLIQAMGGSKVMWYSESKYWPFILTFMQVWKSMGYNMVVYLASITGIDSTLYEAAMLDGATKWQQTRHIPLPSLKPIIVMMFILNVGHIFYSDFGLFWQLTQGIPNSLYNVASTFDTYVFQALQSNVSIGKTAAAGMFQAVCCCVTVLVANFIVSKIDEESAII